MPLQPNILATNKYMHIHNLHCSKIRFNSSWQCVRDEWCGVFMENATVIPSLVFAVWFQSRQIYGSFLQQLAHVDLRRNTTTLVK